MDDELTTLARSSAYHIEVLNREMEEIRDEMRELNQAVSGIARELTTVSADLVWLKKFFWLISGVVSASLLTAIGKLWTG